jgi:hypothetical protein
MAVTIEGNVIINIAHLLDPDELLELRAKLADLGGMVFVGVEVPRRLRGQVGADVRDVLEDVVGRLGPQLRPRRG